MFLMFIQYLEYELFQTKLTQIQVIRSIIYAFVCIEIFYNTYLIKIKKKQHQQIMHVNNYGLNTSLLSMGKKI